MRIEDQTFLVTGGASGLGRATVQRLAASQANVVVADIDSGAGDALAASLEPRVRFLRTDVTKEVEVQRAVHLATETFGRLRGVVHAAGIAFADRILGKTGPHALDRFAQAIQVNLIGTFNVMRLAASAMSSSPLTDSGERGVVICTASIAAFDGQIGQAAYAASKGGVAAMTLPAARELARHAIRVVTIAPGIFDTPLLSGLPEAARQSIGQQVPFPHRLGRPSEYAALVTHVIENEMLNGEVIRLDGAVRMPPQ